MNAPSPNSNSQDVSGPSEEPSISPDAGFAAETQSLPAGLYVVSTPIGNLGDITLRALDILRRVGRIYAEDTRQTRKLLTLHGISSPSLASYHDHNADQAREGVIAALNAGESVALVSDAGTPLVSDPGFKLVRAAHAAGAQVFAVPGASALLAALAISGLPTDRFLFAGFLPSKTAARRMALAELAAVPATLVFYEAPSRVAEALADMAYILGDRPACLARELTKMHEETWRDSLSSLALRAAGEQARGEIVLVIGPPLAGAVPSDESVDAALQLSLNEGASVKDAAAEISGRFGLPRREVYARALVLARAKPAS